MSPAPNSPGKYPVIVSMALLLMAMFLHVTSWYLTLLRVAVCGTAFYLAVFSHITNKKAWMWVLVMVAIVFNPVFPARLPKETWIAVDAFTIGVFLASFSILKIKIK